MWNQIDLLYKGPVSNNVYCLPLIIFKHCFVILYKKWYKCDSSSQEEVDSIFWGFLEDFCLKFEEKSSEDKCKSWYSLMAHSLWNEDKNVKKERMLKALALIVWKVANISLWNSWLNDTAEKSGHAALLKLWDDLSGLSKLVGKILMILGSIEV